MHDYVAHVTGLQLGRRQAVLCFFCSCPPSLPYENENSIQTPSEPRPLEGHQQGVVTVPRDPHAEQRTIRLQPGFPRRSHQRQEHEHSSVQRIGRSRAPPRVKPRGEYRETNVRMSACHDTAPRELTIARSR